MDRKGVLFILTAVIAGSLLIVSAPAVRYALAFAFLWILPGLCWAELIPRRDLEPAAWIAVALGLNFVITPLVTLALAYLPGPLTRTSLILVMTAVISLPLLLSCLRPPAPDVPHKPGLLGHNRAALQAVFSREGGFWRGGWAWLCFAVLIAAGLRLTNLGYAEFQGDEAAVVVCAAQALEGDDLTIFQHKKGPTEVLVVMAPWQLTGITNEWMARLPFAWAGILGIVAVFLLTRRASSSVPAAGLAACLLAIEGYLTAFGRIVQYQSIVFLLSVLGILCLLVYYRTGRAYLVFLAAILFAGGFLGHYDAALALPAGGLLIGMRLWEGRKTQGWRPLLPLAAAALVGLALVACFYLPFFESSFVGETTTYVSRRLGKDDQILRNTLWRTFELSTVYNALYFLLLLSGGLILQLFSTSANWGLAERLKGARSLRWGSWLGAGGITLLLLAAATGLLWPELWVVGPVTFAWLPFLILAGMAFFAPGQPVAIRALWLWLIVPGLFYLFYVQSPNTHVHTFFIPWAILAALGVAQAVTALQGRAKRLLAGAAVIGVGLTLLSGFYTVMMFVDHTPEYRATFPQFKHPLYWTPYAAIDQAGLFGFPYRAGWKVVGYLLDQGLLSGYYDSNEEAPVTSYYTRHAGRWECEAPDFYVTAVRVKDEADIRWEQIGGAYQAAAVVTVQGEEKITIYKEGVQGLPVVYPVEDYAWQFDLLTTPRRVAAASSLESPPADIVPAATRLGDVALLEGYRVDAHEAVPGGYVDLTLVWRALEPSSLASYKVVTHLEAAGSVLGYHSKEPACNLAPTSQWQPDQIIVDRHRIPVSEDAAPGTAVLTVGMVDADASQPLPAFTEAGEPAGEALRLLELPIGERVLPATAIPSDLIFGGVLRLKGYTVDTRYAVPGGYVALTLFWEGLEAIPADYHVFTHLYDGSTMRGQLDKLPYAGDLPISAWRPGELIQDLYRIPIEPNAAPGTVPLTVGIYDPATSQRLPVAHETGEPAEDAVHLADVVIQERQD